MTCAASGRAKWPRVVPTIEIPHESTARLDHLVLDLNGTSRIERELPPCVAAQIEQFAADLQIHLLTAVTLETAARLTSELRVSVSRIATEDDKAAFVGNLGADATAAIGNGRNDAAMLRAARIGIGRRLPCRSPVKEPAPRQVRGSRALEGPRQDAPSCVHPAAADNGIN